MSDLRIDLEAMEHAADRLAMLCGEFASIGELAPHTPDAAGHGHLAAVLKHFRDTWSIRRGRIEAELAFVRDSAAAIHETFSDLDADLAERVRVFTVVEDGG